MQVLQKTDIEDFTACAAKFSNTEDLELELKRTMKRKSNSVSDILFRQNGRYLSLDGERNSVNKRKASKGSYKGCPQVPQPSNK